MKKIILLTAIFFSTLSYAQLNNNCITNALMQRDMDASIDLKVGDTVDTYIEKLQSICKTLVGCQFPYTPFESWDGKQFNTNTFNTDYTFINYNYSFCEDCIAQLDSMIEVKKISNKSISIISFFRYDVKDIPEIIEKYSKDVVIVPNADVYFKYAIMGTPFTYILDRNKVIKLDESYIKKKDLAAILNE